MSGIWKSYDYVTRAMVWSNDATVGKGIFMGCDSHLYMYEFQTDSYTYISSLSDSDYLIRKLWVNSNDSNNIYGVASTEFEVPGDYTFNSYFIIFKYDGSSFTELTSTGTDTIFLGDFCIEDGNTIDGAEWYNVIGEKVGGVTRSENACIPFAQKVRSFFPYTFDTLYYKEPDSIFGFVTPYTEIDSFGSEFSKGYYSIASAANEFEVINSIYLTYSLGQEGFCELLNYGSKGTLVYCSISTGSTAGNYGYYYKEYDLDTLVSSTISGMNDYTIGGVKFAPTCGCYDIQNSDGVFIGGMAWNPDATGETAHNSYILHITGLNSTVSKSILYSSSGDAFNQFITFLSLRNYEDDTYGLLASYIRRDRLGKPDFYGMSPFICSSATTVSILRGVDSPTQLFSPIVSGDLIYYAKDSFLWSYNTFGNPVSLLSDGMPYVDGEPNLSSNLIVISSAEANSIDTERERSEDIVFGVSAPGYPNKTQESPLYGKYYLWKYDSYLSDRVECADFEGKSAWDAMTDLSRLALGYIVGFDTDEFGSFFVTKKDNGTPTTILTVSDEVDDNNLISIQKDRGLSEIYNYVSVIPSVSKLSDVSFELYLNTQGRTSSENNRFVKDGDIKIDVRTNHALQLKCVCVRGGEVDKDFTNLDECPLFKWQTYERDIEAIVLYTASAGSYVVQISSNFRGGVDTEDSDGNPIYVENAININDYVTVVNSTTAEESYIKVAAIVEGSITLADALPFDVNKGTILKVTHPFNVLGTANTTWSSEGVTTASTGATASSTVYVKSVRDLKVGTVIKASGSSFARIANIGVWNASYLGFPLTLSGNTITCSANDTISAYYSPSKNADGVYDYYAVGSTNVNIKIEPSSTNYNSTQFIESDRLTIKTEGLKLEQESQSTSIAQDITSIEKHGRLEYNGNISPYVTRSLAKHYANIIKDSFKDGHYILTIEVRDILNIRFVDSNGLVRVNVKNHKLFPTYNEILCYPREIKYNLSKGTTTLVVRSIDAY